MVPNVSSSYTQPQGSPCLVSSLLGEAVCPYIAFGFLILYDLSFLMDSRKVMILLIVMRMGEMLFQPFYILGRSGTRMFSYLIKHVPSLFLSKAFLAILMYLFS